MVEKDLRCAAREGKVVSHAVGWTSKVDRGKERLEFLNKERGGTQECPGSCFGGKGKIYVISVHLFYFLVRE